MDPEYKKMLLELEVDPGSVYTVTMNNWPTNESRKKTVLVTDIEREATAFALMIANDEFPIEEPVEIKKAMYSMLYDNVTLTKVSKTGYVIYQQSWTMIDKKWWLDRAKAELARAK